MKSVIAVFISLTVSFAIAAQEVRDTTFVYFDFDRFTITSAARSVLDKFISDFRNTSDSSTISIRGHCDYMGSNNYNELLARRRSFAVHEYLLNNGIEKTKVMLVESFGEREPRNENRSAEDRALNRRVEIIRTVKKPPAIIKEDPMPPPKPQLPPPVRIPKDTITDFSKEALDTVQAGQILRLRNINFFPGSHRFLSQAETPLRELLQAMKNNPTLHIEIQGHICCQHDTGGDGHDYDSDDDRLSVNRARAVYDFLVRNGIEPQRMRYRGFAATVPLMYPERTETDRTLNRRVEIKVLKR